MALITGAGRGIGKAIAMRFAQEGCNIAFTDIALNDVVMETEKELQACGVKVKAYASNAANFEVINVNLKSVFNFTKAVQPVMWKQAGGSVINMSSVVGVSGNANQCNYSASKAGIIGFTKSAAKEMGVRNIRHNAIAPGFIITAMTNALPEDVRKAWESLIPLRRGGTPEDVANVALFLASDLSSYVTGQVIHCCGGMNC